MYLCIDNGNSRIKTGVFDTEGTLVHTLTFQTEIQRNLEKLIEDYSIQHIIESTTGQNKIDISSFNVSGVKIELSHSTLLPIEIVYRTPETLGRDRIASACGAHALYPGHHCLVIDAGTCITMDMVLKSGVFIGGNIAPGIRMRLRAMHEQTAKLPLVEPGFPALPFGDSTEHALQNGACLGAIMEIEGILNSARKAYGSVSLVITGGDATHLAAQLESQIFVSPELVIHGLFQILSLNVKNTI